MAFFKKIFGSDRHSRVDYYNEGVDLLTLGKFHEALTSFRLALKDPGTAETPNIPSTSNFITVTRYRVNYVRADGRNTPGVDVPYPFDGGMTVTVGDSPVIAAFTVVRVQAKEEAPLLPLAGFGGALDISTIAEITFFGKDQAGRDVTVSGKLGINFADWGDPD